MTPIRADLLAAKLKAARTGEAPEFAGQLKNQPRYAELLWLLQWASFQPGGLERMVERLIELFGDRFQKDWQENPQRNAQPKLPPVDFRSTLSASSQRN